MNTRVFFMGRAIGFIAVLVFALIAYYFFAYNKVIEEPMVGRVEVGKTVFINGVRITLNRVVQDSRCPIDVQCIQAGAITANVTFWSDTDSETRNMASDEVPLAFDSYRISIINIAPPRMSGREVDPKSYVLTFKVTANPRL